MQHIFCNIFHRSPVFQSYNPTRFQVLKFHTLLKEKNYSEFKFDTKKEFFGTYAWFDLRNFTPYVLSNGSDNVLNLLVEYYSIVELLADKFNGRIAASLGDGIGVVFEGSASSRRAFDMVLEFRSELAERNLPLKFGVGLHTGRIVTGKNNKLKSVNSFYTGKAIIKTYRISGLLGSLKKEIVITQEVFDRLDNSRRKILEFLGTQELKGFEKKVNLFYSGSFS